MQKRARAKPDRKRSTAEKIKLRLDAAWGLLQRDPERRDRYRRVADLIAEPHESDDMRQKIDLALSSWRGPRQKGAPRQRRVEGRVLKAFDYIKAELLRTKRPPSVLALAEHLGCSYEQARYAARHALSLSGMILQD